MRKAANGMKGWPEVGGRPAGCSATTPLPENAARLESNGCNSPHQDEEKAHARHKSTHAAKLFFAPGQPATNSSAVRTSSMKSRSGCSADGGQRSATDLRSGSRLRGRWGGSQAGRAEQPGRQGVSVRAESCAEESTMRALASAANRGPPAENGPHTTHPPGAHGTLGRLPNRLRPTTCAASYRRSALTRP